MSRTAPSVPEGFGKLLGYDSGKMPVIAVILFGGIGVALLAASVAGLGSTRMGLAIVGIIVSLLLLAFAGIMVVGNGTATWFYEWGMVQQGRRGVRSLEYREARQSTFGVWIQREHNNIHMRISLRPADGGSDIHFITVGKQGAAAKPDRMSVEQIRLIGERVARITADRIAADLQRSEIVEWTPGRHFEPAGLRIAKPELFVPWDQISSAEVDPNSGDVEVFVKGFPQPVVKLSTNEMNARPGMLVIQDRCIGGGPSPEPDFQSMADRSGRRDKMSSVPPYFHALATFACKRNRLYRVYVRADELVFIWAGNGSEGLAGAQALGAAGGAKALLGAAAEAAVDSRAKNVDRFSQLQQRPLDELVNDDPRNFRAPVGEIQELRILPRSDGYARSYSDHTHQAILRLRHLTKGKFRMGVASVEDVRIAMKELPAVLGDLCRVEIPWPERKLPCECRFCQVKGGY